MGEIKFRAWDKKREQMFEGGYVGTDGMYRVDVGGTVAIFVHSVPMQFTGLKDKNGKEIYEGDIIAPWHGMDANTYVVFEPMGIGCREVDGTWAGQLHFRTFEVEVIGNIYENPELI